MADSAPKHGNIEDDSEGVNLLYLAAQKKLQSKQASNNSLMSEQDESTPNPTLADLAKTVAPKPSLSEPQQSKARDKSPSPNTDLRMSCKHRVESQKSFADDHLLGSICPKVNCMEKIILCLDISTEMNVPSFRSRAGDKFTPMKLAKRALEIFLYAKNRIDPKHEYALVLLRDTGVWVSDFTKNPVKMICMLKEFEDSWEGNTFDMGTFFEEIAKNISLPKIDKPSVLPPPYVVRVVFLYGRSHCVPTSSSSEAQKLLQSSPYFFVDALYIHEAPSEDNKCEEVFDTICELDVTGLSSVLEVSKNPTRFYDCMAQLLPHPLQRPLQKDVEYDIESYGPKENNLG